MTSPDPRLQAAVFSGDSSSAYLAGLAVTLPTLSGDALRSLAVVQEDLLKALEKAELPVAPTVGAGLKVTGREVPWLTMVAFAAGALMLVALGIFGGALLKLSMADSRKVRRLRRRYAP